MNNKIVKYSLFLIALGVIAGLLLGLVNSITAPIIAERKSEEAAKALRQYYDYASYSESQVDNYEFNNPAILDLYFTFDADDKFASAIYKTTAQGYKSEVVAYVEIKADGKFGNIVILDSGNDDRAIRLKDYKYGLDTGDINDFNFIPLTGVTLSSNAVKTGLVAAIEHFKTLNIGGIKK